MSEYIENVENTELETDKDFKVNQLEEFIINQAIEHIASDVATEEEKLIVKLWEIDNFTASIDKIFGEIQPLDTKDDNIKQSFINLENAFVNTYNTIYKSCGNCSVYTCDTIFQYLSDVFIQKIEEKQSQPSRTFVLLDLIRNEMESNKWYTIEDMWNILKFYPEYKDILKRENVGLLLNICVQEGYFEEKKDVTRGKTLKRYFKKTEKEYLDLEEEKVGTKI